MAFKVASGIGGVLSVVLVALFWSSMLSYVILGLIGIFAIAFVMAAFRPNQFTEVLLFVSLIAWVGFVGSMSFVILSVYFGDPRLSRFGEAMLVWLLKR